MLDGAANYGGLIQYSSILNAILDYPIKHNNTHTHKNVFGF